MKTPSKASKIAMLAAIAQSAASAPTEASSRRLHSSATATAATTSSTSSTVTLPAEWTLPKRIDDCIPIISTIPRGGGSNNDDDNDNDDTADDNKKSKKSNANKSQKKKKNKKKFSSGSSKSSSKDDEENNKSSSKASASNPTENSETTSHQKSKTTKSTPTNTFVEEILQQECYYQVLGVEKGATSVQLQKAYRKRAVQTHPDKTGGDRRAFDVVAEAYDTLTDDTKRQLYDHFGKAGLDQADAGGGGATGFGGVNDLFRNMFHQQQQQQRQQQYARNRRPKNPTTRYQLQVTLEDLYFGKSHTIAVSSNSGRQFHPFQQQRQQQSNRKSKQVTVDIPKGATTGQSIVLSGEMDFVENETPGDLIFIISQAPHSAFTRKNHDLAMELTISLKDAICGFDDIPIQHLDGSTIWLQSARQSPSPSSSSSGDKKNNSMPIMIETGHVQVLKGKGMPKRKPRSGIVGDDDDDEDQEYGDLYIQYRVEMPKSQTSRRGGKHPLTSEEIEELKRLLHKLDGSSSRHQSRRSKKPSSEDDVITLESAKPADFGRASGSVMEDGYDNHDDHDPHSHFQDEDFGDHPFASQFGGSSSGSSGFFFGSSGGFHTFGGSRGNNDDGNVECQQM